MNKDEWDALEDEFKRLEDGLDRMTVKALRLQDLLNKNIALLDTTKDEFNEQEVRIDRLTEKASRLQALLNNNIALLDKFASSKIELSQDWNNLNCRLEKMFQPTV